MTPEDALLRDILAEPDDNGLRLIYADWLDDHGDADRAEFVRVQVERASPPLPDLRGPERAAELRAAHREDWLVAFGLPLSWANVVAVVRWRLAEAVAWCWGQEVARLRTPALEPAPLLGWGEGNGSGRVWRRPPPEERQATVNDLAIHRARLLADGGLPAAAEGDLAGGRLLLFYPDDTLFDGAAELESGGFFDTENVPAWDTWVWVQDDDRPHAGPPASGPYLVCWVPPHLLAAADAGVRVNPEECIRWAADVDTLLTRRLRAAGLLA